MKPHKWAKEIHAWADGAEIEFNLGNDWHKWSYGFDPLWDMDDYKFRIKPQPKEPQYLYVYQDVNDKQIFITNGDVCSTSTDVYIGKIKLETDK